MPQHAAIIKQTAAESGIPADSAQRIVSQARAHFFAHGFRGVTMDELAAELGMSKKTLYLHFPSKRALLEAVMVDKLATVEAGLNDVLGGAAGDFPRRLQAMLAFMREQTAEIQPVFVRDVRREAPELFAAVQEGRRKVIQGAFGKLLQEGRKAGRIRRDIPPEIMVEMLIGAVDAIVNPARLEELGLSPRSGFSHIISIFMEGVLVRPPPAKS